ncbi:MAG: LTA synthase family protein [Candidatus Heteroscillospira sp.]|jgi:lipoteichoic acid synthase
MKRNTLNSLIFLPAALVYLELFTKLSCFGSVSFQGAVFTLLFSLSAGALLTWLCALAGERGFFPALLGILAALCLLFAVQNVYHSIFGAFLTLRSVLEAPDVLSDFGREALTGIGRAWKSILMCVLPLFLAVILRRHFDFPDGHTRRRRVFCVFLLLHVAAVCCVFINGRGVISPRYLYTGSFMPELSTRYFGVVTALRQDMAQLLFPADSLPEPEVIPGPSPTPSPQAPEDTEEPVYAPNVLPIDFSALAESETDDSLRSMHSHFASVNPTMQNEYTGMFEGKNLIWIVAEGFSDLALDETHTPSLYKLANSGFVFNNFYTPSWGVSTSDGEYVTLTGLLPKSGVWSFSESAENNMGMTFGRMLGAGGYECRAYHDHTYTYYDRDKSHPNMGYDYKAVGNGLVMENVWPNSDLEMMQKTVGEYIGADKFHTYYMTVSGHMYYTFVGNTQAWKHRDEVADLPYSENCRAYIACNMEFDLAVEYLLDELEKAGKLEDTVIVISGDHYPYGLTQSEIEEIRGQSVDSFELYRSSLIIWCGDMDKPIEIDKPCYAADIMPTLANLFGLDYDSRLLAGRDILSDEPGLVIFANRSFISELGRYDSAKDEFTPAPGAEVPESYARDMLYGRVEDAFTYSAAILDKDYYSVVLPGADGGEDMVN